MNYTCIWLALLLQLSFSVAANCQPVDESQDTSNLNASMTIIDAKTRLDKERELAMLLLTNAEKNYQASVEKADGIAIRDIEQIAKKQIAAGELTSASSSWEAVLEIDPDNKAAEEFFETIGRMDVVKRIKKKNAKAKKKSEATGRRRIVFKGGLDNQLRFEFVTTGQWRLGDESLRETSRTAHTISLLADNGDHYRIHDDALYGRNKSSKWFLHGSGKWLK